MRSRYRVSSASAAADILVGHTVTAPVGSVGSSDLQRVCDLQQASTYKIQQKHTKFARHPQMFEHFTCQPQELYLALSHNNALIKLNCYLH